MTRNRSNRGRQRRGRNRPQDAVNPEQAESAVADSPTPDPPAESDGESQASQRFAPEARQGQGRPPEGARAGGRPPSRAGSRGDQGGEGGSSRSGQGRNRRRGQRRNQMLAMPGEVLKPNAPRARLRETPATHTLEEISGDGEPVFGCPMLTRTRIELPVTGGNHAPRCSLGWAIHSETEASYCLDTPDHVQCWKAHPERLAEILARREEAVTAAD